MMGHEPGNPEDGNDQEDAAAAAPEVVEESEDAEAVQEAEPVPEVEAVVVDPMLMAEREARLRAEAELAAMSTRYEEMTGKLRAVSKAYKDREDDMESFRKRLQADAAVRSETKANQLVRQFFEPVMNLRRALEQPGDDFATFLDGTKLVLGQFEGVLSRLGIEEAPGVGAVFDPNIHEALAVIPVTDPEGDGKILNVHAAGYTVNGKCLQAAQVVVGKYTEPAEA